MKMSQFKEMNLLNFLSHVFPLIMVCACFALSGYTADTMQSIAFHYERMSKELAILNHNEEKLVKYLVQLNNNLEIAERNKGK